MRDVNDVVFALYTPSYKRAVSRSLNILWFPLVRPNGFSKL